MEEAELKEILFKKAMEWLKEVHYQSDGMTLDDIYRMWFRDCGDKCVPEKFAEHLHGRIADKFYCLLDAIRDVLVEEGLIDRYYEVKIAIWPSNEDITQCVLHYRGVVLLEVEAKVRHLNGMSREEFKDMLYSWYRTAKNRVFTYRGLGQTLKELQMARCNAEHCPEHREEADGMPELEHVDIHVDGAITALERFLKK